MPIRTLDGLRLRAPAVMLLAAIAPSPTSPAVAAQGRVPHVAVISTVSAEYAAPYLQSGREGLADVGYVEGKTMILAFRFAGFGKLNPDDLATELVALKPDVMVAVGDRAVAAAQRAPRAVPTAA